MRYLERLEEAYKRYARLEKAETAAENRASRAFKARDKEYAIANAEGERAAGQEATANAAASLLPKQGQSKQGRRAARRMVSRMLRQARRSRRNERKADDAGARQGDRHWDAQDKAIKYRDARKALTGESYRQIGDIIAEALNLFEAKNPPMPSPEELSLPGEQGAPARFEQGEIIAAKRRGKTTPTTKNTRRRRKKMAKNFRLKRGSADTRQYGGGPMGRMAQRGLQAFLDKGVPAQDSK